MHNSGLIATLPVHLLCQLINSGNYSLENLTLPADTKFSQGTAFLPEGYTSFPDLGVAMKYYSNDLTWNLARKHCIMEGGNLAVIDSFEKAKQANALRKTNPRGPFLGIHRLYDDFEWVSVKTGLPLSFIPWKSGLNQTAKGPLCTALYGEYGGKVGPFECERSWSYVCEIPIIRYECTVQHSPLQNQTGVNETMGNENPEELVSN